jgi:hypothetical protein
MRKHTTIGKTRIGELQIKSLTSNQNSSKGVPWNPQNKRESRLIPLDSLSLRKKRNFKKQKLIVKNIK